LESTGLAVTYDRHLQAADSHTGIRGFFVYRTTTRPREVNNMTLSVLDALVASDLPDAQTLPCRLNDPELFFAESPADVELAKALCQTCPVRAECLAGALERHEPWGVWGGQLLVAGAVVARKRPRGRPRKCEVAA
jgi:WhiB family redox-sensing transcriptional regulator